jgi:hypothetical protein
MKKILALLFFYSTMSGAIAQDYNAAIGLRGGLYNGVTFRKMLSSSEAFEAILSARYVGFKVTGLYEIQKPFPSVQRLNWYFGFGAHASGYQTNKFNKTIPSNTTEIILGADGVLGMEYNFDFPLNLSLDWKPSVDLIGYGRFLADEFALSARYYS